VRLGEWLQQRGWRVHDLGIDRIDDELGQHHLRESESAE
jgi:hypothetical protein